MQPAGLASLWLGRDGGARVRSGLREQHAACADTQGAERATTVAANYRQKSDRADKGLERYLLEHELEGGALLGPCVGGLWAYRGGRRPPVWMNDKVTLPVLLSSTIACKYATVLSDVRSLAILREESVP
jgi:hypothetical protein